MTGVYQAIVAERVRQDAKWGGPAHDDQHGCGDWAMFREIRERRLRDAMQLHAPFDGHLWHQATRKNLVEIAALCVAQIEALDRWPV